MRRECVGCVTVPCSSVPSSALVIQVILSDITCYDATTCYDVTFVTCDVIDFRNYKFYKLLTELHVLL